MLSPLLCPVGFLRLQAVVFIFSLLSPHQESASFIVANLNNANTLLYFATLPIH
ncbi:hypothetical protein RND81_10G034800 [Saponaria officinalis]|uniref:Uncharacterized protein n=1 Tax=Saponaria officinalis TaxID=3572 RepID=A0AAW1HXP6_SAPOF